MVSVTSVERKGTRQMSVDQRIKNLEADSMVIATSVAKRVIWPKTAG